MSEPLRPAGSRAGGEPATACPPPFESVVRYFLGLGTWGFGGPIVTVGYMQRDLVERRNWMTRADFLDGVALGQTMRSFCSSDGRPGSPTSWRWVRSPESFFTKNRVPGRRRPGGQAAGGRDGAGLRAETEATAAAGPVEDGAHGCGQP
jgi:hypothetical protein